MWTVVSGLQCYQVYHDQLCSLNTGGVNPKALSPANKADSSLAIRITLDGRGTGHSPRCQAFNMRYQLGTGAPEVVVSL